MQPTKIIASLMLAASLMSCPAQTSPPEITLNGLTTILGDKLAMFRTSGPEGEKSYLIAEGEQQDGIAVLSVNVQTGVVKVNNHGLVQTISICSTPALVSSAAGAASGAAAAKPGGKSPGAMSVANLPAPAGETQPSAGDTASPSGVVLATGGSHSDGSASGNSQTGGSQTGGSQQAGGSPSAASGSGNITDYAVQGYHWWIQEAQKVEQARSATAQQVLDGSIPPYPLTPLTPAGTPAPLIGSGKIFFIYDPMASTD